jgi:hypothetical protein
MGTHSVSAPEIIRRTPCWVAIFRRAINDGEMGRAAFADFHEVSWYCNRTARDVEHDLLGCSVAHNRIPYAMTQEGGLGDRPQTSPTDYFRHRSQISET